MKNVSFKTTNQTVRLQYIFWLTYTMCRKKCQIVSWGILKNNWRFMLTKWIVAAISCKSLKEQWFLCRKCWIFMCILTANEHIFFWPFTHLYLDQITGRVIQAFARAVVHCKCLWKFVDHLNAASPISFIFYGKLCWVRAGIVVWNQPQNFQ